MCYVVFGVVCLVYSVVVFLCCWALCPHAHVSNKESKGRPVVEARSLTTRASHKELPNKEQGKRPTRCDKRDQVDLPPRRHLVPIGCEPGSSARITLMSLPR